MRQLEDALQWRGRKLVGRYGETIGTIESIYVDDETNTPEWATVRMGRFSAVSTFVPLVNVSPEGENVRAPYTKEEVDDAPKLAAEGVLSKAHEAQLYRHFGIGYSSSGSRTGLPDAPGARSERRPEPDPGSPAAGLPTAAATPFPVPVEDIGSPSPQPAPPVDDVAPPSPVPAPPVEDVAPPSPPPAPPVEDVAPPSPPPAPPVEDVAPPSPPPAPPVEDVAPPAPPVEQSPQPAELRPDDAPGADTTGSGAPAVPESADSGSSVDDATDEAPSAHEPPSPGAAAEGDRGAARSQPLTDAQQAQIERTVRLYRMGHASYDFQAGPAEPVRRRAVEKLDLGPGDVVLDVDCGTGLAFELIQERIGPTGRLIGVDVSPHMLQWARMRANRWDNVVLIESPAETAELPFEADAVLFSFCHDILQSERAIENVLTVVRPRARVAAAGHKWAEWWAPGMNGYIALMAMQ